jgi:diacylglycerol kinase family enzyme
VLGLLRARGWKTDLIQASDGPGIAAAARQSLAAGAEIVVAGGGDGTVSTVATVVAGSKALLGVVPLGTLNHFARDLGIPLNLDAATEILVKGRIVAIDIGEVNGFKFINNSSLGLYPSIVRYRESREKTGWSRLLAFGAACVMAFRRYRFLTLRLEVDGTVHNRKSPFLFVGNNQYEVEGLRLGRRRRLDEGFLSLHLSDRTGRFGLIRIGLSALLHRLRLNHDFVILPAQNLIVHTRRKRIQVALDGEVHKLHPPLRYSIRPGFLRVMGPA